MLFFFLSSGLFLGWALGANDAANVFGSAVGTRMVSFVKAAAIATIFVILGSVVQGAGAAHTLGKLGSISALGGAFTVALSAAFTVFWMTKLKVPVSTSQAIVGAIIGWNFYTQNPTDLGTLTKIVSTWVMGPILGAVFAVMLYQLMASIFKKSNIHLLKEDAYIRMGLLVVGAFGSYSLGANNIANVMGVFVPMAPTGVLDFGLFQLNGTQQLFLLGSIAISVGIFTYSKRVMETVGNSLMELSSKAAIVIVLSHSIVLFIFSSQSLSDFVQSIGLPGIPLVPVSSSQVIVGAIIGIGLLKGGHNINLKVFGGISIGWVTTPIIAGILSFFALFFVDNVFLLPIQAEKQTVEVLEPSSSEKIVGEDTLIQLAENQESVFPISETTGVQPIAKESITDTPSFKIDTTKFNNSEEVPAKKNVSRFFYFGIFSLFAVGMAYAIYQWFGGLYKKNKKLLNKNQEILEAQKALAEAETKYHLLESKQMEEELKFKKKELMTMALNLIEKNDFIDLLKEEIEALQGLSKNPALLKRFNNLYLHITHKQSLDEDREAFHLQVDELSKDFFFKLNQKFPMLTKNERRLCVYLRLNMSSKEIATLMNISTKSVEMGRYRLRKKLSLPHEKQLSKFLQQI
ncbi:MAG: hypothetical protein GY705_04045 [Bacteroidetes bacterium]|nr:hypothetical protein [Bacteroidota bacterium]